MIGSLLQPELAELIRQRNFSQLREILCDFPPPDIAEILGDLSAEDKAVLLRILPHDLATAVFEYLSVEDQENVHRIEDLEHVPAAVRFLSIEPLLGPIERLPLLGIQWVIVGGESGPKARPMEKEWVESILSQCHEAGVAFFFKQWGGVRKKRAGRVLNGKTYDEMPSPLQLLLRGSSPDKNSRRASALSRRGALPEPRCDGSPSG